MQWEVILDSEVDEWYLALDSGSADAVAGAIELLEESGPTLGRPVVDRVKGSTFHSMKELRPSGTSIRILFVFDPQRRAVLLLAGDKAGQWNKWYDENIPIADARYTRWLEDLQSDEV